MTHCLLAGHWLLPRSVPIQLTGTNDESNNYFVPPSMNSSMKVKYRKTPKKSIDQNSLDTFTPVKEAEYVHPSKNETDDAMKITEEPKAGYPSIGPRNLIQRIITMRRGGDKQRASMSTMNSPGKSENAEISAKSIEIDSDMQVTEESANEFDSYDTKDQTSLLCHRCDESVTLNKKNRSAKMIRHILNCLGLQPYTCSACKYKTSIRHNVMRHMTSCPSSESAQLTIAEKEETEKAVFEGIEECFPGHTIAWRGLGE